MVLILVPTTITMMTLMMFLMNTNQIVDDAVVGKEGNDENVAIIMMMILVLVLVLMLMIMLDEAL